MLQSIHVDPLIFVTLVDLYSTAILLVVRKLSVVPRAILLDVQPFSLPYIVLELTLV